jgi:hypothetical protein
MPGQTQVVTITVRDSFDLHLTGSCTFVVTLADGSAPVPTVSGNLPTYESFCGSVIIDAPTATDNAPGCNPIPNIIYGTPSTPVGMLIPGSNPPQYNFIYTPAFGNPSNYVVTWIYNDGNGNQSSQLQNIIVWKDDFPPVAKCKNISVDLSSALNGTANVSITPAMVDDGSNDNGPMGCGQSVNLISVLPNGFGCANIGPNTVTLTVTDDAVPANSATCTAIVTVRDLTTPVLNGVPANITIESCRDTIPAAAVVTSSDNCTAPVVYTEVSTKGTAGCSKYTYTLTRSWVATDGGGNFAAATQTITVQDTKAPMFAASVANLTVNTEASDADCDAVVTLDITSAITDSCSAANEITIQQTYSGPGRILNIGCSGGCASGIYEKGVHTLTFTATDNCGNAAEKTITITVNDATIPTAVCINGVSAALLVSGTVVLSTNQFNNMSYDNCAGTLDLKVQRVDQLPLQLPSNTVVFSCADADGVTQHPVKLYVTDAAGNVSTCQTFVVIQDNNAPSISCPPNVTLNCTDDHTATVQGAGVPTVSDNCPSNLLPQAPPTDVVSDGMGATCELITRTWLAEDIAHNTSTCVQTISIVDNIAPTLSAQPGNVTISCSDPLVAWPVITASDNCGTAVTIDQDTVSTQTSLGCGKYSYVETRTWTATDACGNKATHTQVVTVTDLVAPQFIGAPDTLTVLSSQQPLSNNCTVPVNFDIRDFIVECADSADIVVVNTISPALSGIGTGSIIDGAYPVGEYTVEFKATDACGNMSLDTIVLVVIDNSVPTMVCNNNVVVALGTNGEGTISPDDIDLGSTDNCDIDTLVLSQSIFDCADLGVNTIQLTATDIYGNSNFCNVDVNVTLGTNTGFTLVATGTPESYFGAGNGSATAVATLGSGNYTYTWSTNATTSNITGLAAGTYSVTVVDSSSGCLSVDTVIVAAGPKVTINVGTGDGCQNEMVTIPVTVDNFIDVSGFSFGLMLSNGAVGTITSITDVNPALTGLVPGVNSVFWTHPTLAPTTLANGSLLFNLNIQLSTTAQGTNSSIDASALPALVFLQNGTTQAPMVNFNSGLVTISCVAGNIGLLGEINTWKVPVKPVPNVNVALTGTSVGNDVTALPLADYQFLVSAGANTVVTPSKSEAAKNNKINVGDLLLIQAHAAPPPVQIPFTSPYQWVAADINGSGTVNLVDYALVQAYIINNMPSNGHFAGAPTPPDWKFVPKAYIFPVPDPLSPAPPSNITHNNIAVPFLDDDFVGILMGDVNGDVAPSVTGGGGNESSGEAFKFLLNDRKLNAGETIVVPFKALDFNKRQAYQMTIAFDPEVMQLEGITPGVLPGLADANFGTQNLTDGLLSTLWVGATPLTLADDATLFSLTFKVNENADALSGVIRPSSDVTEALAIDKFGEIIPVDFEFASSVAVGDLTAKTFALYQNQPNPFSAETSIAFRLPEAGRATLRVFSSEGRLVKMVAGEYGEGMNVVKFNKSDIGSNGVYYYELETAGHSDRKKMILID